MTTCHSELEEVLFSKLSSTISIRDALLNRIKESATFPISSAEEVILYVNHLCPPQSDVDFLAIENMDGLLKKAEYYREISEEEDTYI